MNALKLLEAQHLTTTRMFERIYTARGHVEQKLRFQELAQHLAAHAEVEERVLFRGLHDALPQEVLRLHANIKQQVLEILDLPRGDESFHEKVWSLHRELGQSNASREQLVRGFYDGFLSTLGAEMQVILEDALQEPPVRLLTKRAVVRN